MARHRSPGACERGGSLSSERKRYRKCRAPAGFADDVDCAAMGFDDGLDEAETETETALRAALVAAEEPIEDLRQLIGGGGRTAGARAGPGGVRRRAGRALPTCPRRPGFVR